MAIKHSRTSASAEELLASADDLTRIKGIGPGVAKRLHDAGVLTFAQLATLSPADIATLLTDMAGFSAKRVAKQAWIKQAAVLASRKSQLALTAPIARQHYATFTVELLLNENNEVRRTRVVHIQRGHEDAWPGWEEARLVNFFHESSSMHPRPAPKPALPEKVEASRAEPQLPTGFQLEVGDISLKALEGDEQRANRMRAQINFRFSGTQAYLVAAQESPCVVHLLASELVTGYAVVLASGKLRLPANTLDHSAIIEFELPEVGRYQILGMVMLPAANRVAVNIGPVLRVSLEPQPL